MTNWISYHTPLGAKGKAIPRAPIAPAKTSKDLVSDDQSDAFYFRALESSGIALNGRQIEAVRHFEGPILTLAGAGSGKTSVLVARTGYLMAVRDVPPANILLVTFSTKAAAEMKQRIARLPGITSRMARDVQARTFHSFFLLLLRKQGYTQDIFSETRYQHIIIKRMLRERRLQDDYEPETLLSALSAHKMNLVRLDSLPERTTDEKNVKHILLQYEQWKADNNKMDFDDIFVYAHDLLLRSPTLLSTLQNRFRHVMNDEFQDTNKLQYELVRMIAAPQHNLMVVGDDDQTIYTFQGASHEFILQFHHQYPGARTVTLDINYRSTEAIVGLGNEVIRHNTRRKGKTLLAAKQSDVLPQYCRPGTTDEEAQAVLGRIRDEVRQGGRSYGDFAILYRSASSSRAMLEELVMSGIPFVHYGSDDSFYEQWAVRPLIDHLRLALDRRNFDAMGGVVQTLYIGRDRGMDFIYHSEKAKRLKGPLIHLLELPELKSFQKDKIVERIKLLRTMAEMKPADAIRHMRRTFYDAFMETADSRALTPHKEMLKETLDELEASAKRFDSPADFIQHIDRMTEMHQAMEQLRGDPGADTVSLMTIHKAKGLEFPVVFVIGASEGILPHSSALEAGSGSPKGDGRAKDAQHQSLAALEEERRLAYVAITRAKEELIISSPAYYRGKKANVSRFIMAPFAAAGNAAATRSASSSAMTTTPGAAAKPKTRLQTVPAWICTGSGCMAWSRISSAAERELKGKLCPLCGTPMRLGTREVPV